MPPRPRKFQVVFFPAHPAQLWMMHALAPELTTFADIHWVIRSKDCMADLASRLGLKATIVSSAQRGIWKNGFEFAANIVRTFRFTRQHNIDLWFTKYGAANMAARLASRKSISFNDDDADVVPFIAWSSYPFADMVLAPTVTRMGRFSEKTERYASYHELFYLHPNRFTPDRRIFEKLGLAEGAPYAIIRLSALGAHHDVGIRGIQTRMIKELITLIGDRVHIIISSEAELAPELFPMRFSIPVDEIHHALAFATFLIGDSQTMVAEAAVLGTPAIRISDFYGRLSYLNDLEAYGLAYGFHPDDTQGVFPLIERIIAGEGENHTILRDAMLREKIDPIPWVAERIKHILGLS